MISRANIQTDLQFCCNFGWNVCQYRGCNNSILMPGSCWSFPDVVENQWQISCNPQSPEFVWYQLTQIVFHTTMTRLFDDNKHESNLCLITTQSSKSSPQKASVTLSHYMKLITANRQEKIKEAARMDGGDWQSDRRVEGGQKITEWLIKKWQGREEVKRSN